MVPEPSSSPQRPTSPVCGVVICALTLARICAAVRATFQIRTSSNGPTNSPSRAPVVVVAVMKFIGANVAVSGGRLTASEDSSWPFR